MIFVCVIAQQPSQPRPTFQVDEVPCCQVLLLITNKAILDIPWPALTEVRNRRCDCNALAEIPHIMLFTLQALVSYALQWLGVLSSRQDWVYCVLAAVVRVSDPGSQYHVGCVVHSSLLNTGSEQARFKRQGLDYITQVGVCSLLN
jgi:hypothetical protein